MELKKEKSFPRGGRKPALFKSGTHSALSFFRKPKVKSKLKNNKKVKQLENKNIAEETTKLSKEGFTVKFVEDLKPSIIQDGMLILGIISKVMDKMVIVSLPGGLRGGITLANVSEFYTNIIQNSSESSEIPKLMDIFQVGDVLPVKVLSTSETHHALMLTSDPKAVNEKLSYKLMDNNLILTGSVKSEEDHGFVIDFGIEHVHGFLNYEKVNKNVNLKVGQLVRCCVIQCNMSLGSCNVQLSVLKKDIQSAFLKKSSTLSTFCFIPGLQFEVTIKKILAEGVEVSCTQVDSLKGYIHEDHFLKKFSTPADLEIGSRIIATLLYIKPMVNFLYFKIMPRKDFEWPFQFGEIVSGKVTKVRRSGVFFKINEGSRKGKCFVPISKLQRAMNLQEKSDILHLYPINKKVPKIRLQNTDFMGRYYVGATDKASVQEKYFSIFDIKCGEIVPCEVIGFGKSITRLKIGKRIKGVVAYSDMTDVPIKNPASKFKIGQKVKARVLEVLTEKLLVRLTMKPTLLKEQEILCDSNKYKKNSQYVGTVIKIVHDKIIVKFFNSVIGVIRKHLTPYPDAKSLSDHFYIGQLVKCFVIGVQEKNRLLLSLLELNSNPQLLVGKKYNAVVINKTERGLFLDVIVDEGKKCKGYLPRTLLTIHRTLIPALHATYSPGEKLLAYCVGCNNNDTEPPLFAAEEVLKEFYEGKSEKELQKLLMENSVLPFLFKAKNGKTNHIYLKSLIPNKDLTVMVVRNDFPENLSFLKYELVYGKILKIRKKRIEVSTQVRDVWDKDFHCSLDFLDSYLKAMSALVLRQKNKLNAYNGNICLCGPIKGVAEEVKTGHAIVRTEDGDLGIAEGKFEVGQIVKGKIVWIDGPEQIFYLKTGIDLVENNYKKRPLVVKGHAFLRGRVAFISQEVIVLELRGRGRGELAFLPRKRHLNDIMSPECVVALGEELKLWVTRKNSNYLLAMDRRVVLLQEKITWKKSETRLNQSVQSLKRKLESEKMERLKKRKTVSDSDEIQVVNIKHSDKSKKENMEEESHELVEVKEEVNSDNDAYIGTNNDTSQLDFDDIDIKLEVDSNENEEKKQMFNVENDEKIELSSSSESEDEQNFEEIESLKAFGMGFNWDVLNNPSLLSGVPLSKEESSEEEDEDLQHDKKKRRRLTAVEKREKAKTEEERLRFIEERLMDNEREPENIDDFDRAVLANPNSSALWLKYMAFHIQGTEIEKARAVARRALKAISFREEQEKLNVWIALLNLENMYGSEDSLSKTLNEALQVNEPYKIQLHLLNIHGQSNKLQEMEKLGNFMLKKYKDMGNMWYDVAAAYFSVGKVESARNVLQKALTILDKSQHISLISKFAQLENRHGSPERAQTLYESVLASFPKRVDIWCCYVDMLIKSNLIDLARQVLERATSQSLRPRKMKTLFKKFIAFEEAHGNPESVEKVREAAVEYVETLGSVDV